jgi:hypothetical protein
MTLCGAFTGLSNIFLNEPLAALALASWALSPGVSVPKRHTYKVKNDPNAARPINKFLANCQLTHLRENANILNN